MCKRLFPVAALAALSLTLSACNGNSAHSTPSASPATQDVTNSPSSYVFSIKNTSVSIDQNMSEVLDALGEANSYFEATSCAFEGLDKTYAYSGFVITTRPDGDEDFVNSIRLTDDSVTTTEGVYIGATQEDVLDTYGDTQVENDVIQYTLGNTTLNFILQEKTVVSIEYIPA